MHQQLECPYGSLAVLYLKKIRDVSTYVCGGLWSRTRFPSFKVGLVAFLVRSGFLCNYVMVNICINLLH